MKLYNDKCENILKTIEDNSIDAVITDPPYGINFMNKKWDYDVPSVDTFKEILRVMKPGATLLCFAGTRTQHRMAVNIEDAGFILKDTIMWLYGSGFPKATDISKQLDKGVEREVIGTRIQRFGLSENKGWNTNNLSRTNAEIDITAPATEEAKKWNGWKSHGLKPAYEPIIVAVKPNEGSYAENALKWGVSGINIDDCRIKGCWNRSTTTIQDIKGGNFNRQEDRDKKSHTKGRYPANIILSHHPECELIGIKEVKSNTHYTHKREIGTNGIYSSGGYEDKLENEYNISKEVIEDWKCHEDCPIRMLDEQSNIKHRNDEDIIKSNEGGASRFFYCAKASKSERDLGCENLEEKPCGLMEDDNYPIETGSGNIRDTKRRNNHPTVKPLALMEYLCKMISMPEKITVLDPYMGSGTTGMACINTGLDFIGMEKEPEYFEIAKCRINHIKEEVIEKPKKIKEKLNLFFDIGD